MYNVQCTMCTLHNEVHTAHGSTMYQSQIENQTKKTNLIVRRACLYRCDKETISTMASDLMFGGGDGGGDHIISEQLLGQK